MEKYSVNLALDNCQGTYVELFHDAVQIESPHEAGTADFYWVAW